MSLRTYVTAYVLCINFLLEDHKKWVHLFHWIKQMQLVQNTKHQLTFGFDFYSFLLLEFCPKYVIESS